MDSSSKAQRLLLIRQRLYSISPRGLSAAELGREFNIGRSAALKNLRSASEIWPQIQQDPQDLRWYFQRKSRMLEVAFTPEEARILHLATRLFSRQMPKGLPASVSALEKLAAAAGDASPVTAKLIEGTAHELESSHDVDQEQQAYQARIQLIHQALEEKRSIRLEYIKKDQSTSLYEVQPLFLEPYSEGRSLYLCCRDLGQPRYLTLKTESILEVRLAKVWGSTLLKRQEEPTTRESELDLWREDLAKRLAMAWGIWSGEKDVQPVRLVFNHRVKDRVLQTQWHQSQSTEETPRGLILQVDIPAPMEMYPWIRSWGPEVEILEPEWLREQWKADLRAALDIAEGS